MVRKFFLLVMMCCAALAVSHATSVLPLQLDRIIDDAELAFQGICIGNRSEREATTGLIVTYSTFDVLDTLKGSLGASHTIKQIGGQGDGMRHRVEGVPTFAVGQEYVVFLYGMSRAGFSSPVGLGQGQFTVSDGPGGKILSNGRDFNELIPVTADWAADQPAAPDLRAGTGERTHLKLDDFKQIVRRHGGNPK